MTDHGRHPTRPAKFKAGDRVIWAPTSPRLRGREFPAVVVDEPRWYRRTAEPWCYAITLDRTDDTRRMSHLLRFPGESQLRPEPHPVTARRGGAR